MTKETLYRSTIFVLILTLVIIGSYSLGKTSSQARSGTDLFTRLISTNVGKNSQDFMDDVLALLQKTKQNENTFRYDMSEFLDLNGDGLADFIYADNQKKIAQVYENTGTNNFKLVYSFEGSSSESDLMDNVLLVYADFTPNDNDYDYQIGQFIDINSDGLIDFLYSGYLLKPGQMEADLYQRVYLNTGTYNFTISYECWHDYETDVWYGDCA